MELLFFKRYIIIFLVIALTISLVYYLISKVNKPYHQIVSDTDEPYLKLDFVGYTDYLNIYTVNDGNSLFLQCVSGDSVSSDNHDFPETYKTPYDYVMSGEIDDEITQLRKAADLKESRRIQRSTEEHLTNQNHLTKLPVKFKDVGDEIRRKLGVI